MTEEFKWTKMGREVVILGPDACGQCGRTQTTPADRVWRVVAWLLWDGIDTKAEKRVFRAEQVAGEKLNLFEATALKNDIEKEPMPEDPTKDAVEWKGEKQEDKK